jgi:hypothetical protein
LENEDNHVDQAPNSGIALYLGGSVPETLSIVRYETDGEWSRLKGELRGSHIADARGTHKFYCSSQSYVSKTNLTSDGLFPNDGAALFAIPEHDIWVLQHDI